MIDLSKVRAIDVHVHADVSCHDRRSGHGAVLRCGVRVISRRRASARIPEIIDLYRGQQIAFASSTVDCESSLGAKRVSNYDRKITAPDDDIVILSLRSIRARSRMGARERATSSRITRTGLQVPRHHAGHPSCRSHRYPISR